MRRMVAEERRAQVAYFTMEVALREDLPTYSGGLGVLAGDFLMSAADAGADMLAVTILHRQGYLRQVIDASGSQVDEPVVWRPEDVLELLAPRTTVRIGSRSVLVAAWRLVVTGATGESIDVYFLDTDLPDNHNADRDLSGRLYGGDNEYRLRQEALLGLGGVAMLRELGHDAVDTYHMNEGHSSLLTLALLEERMSEASNAVHPVPARFVDSVRKRCVFTTHTPVPAGHDRFADGLVKDVLGPDRAQLLDEIGCIVDGELNMSWLGMRMSRAANAVSQRHREVAQAMFPTVPMLAVTNGVHAHRWVSAPFRELFDKSIPGWRCNNDLLRYVSQIDAAEIAAAHQASKQLLLDTVAQRTDRKLDPAALTIGAARRVTPYKQTTMIFSDLERLTRAAQSIGPVQIVCAGKAHPRDEEGKALVSELVRIAAAVRGPLDVVFLEDYDLDLAATLCAGSDIWLNTPLKPLEASGTSGMKAALNGVPSLSVLDGWWLEGCVEGVTGWAIGNGAAGDNDPVASELYDKLESVVLPVFYGQALTLAGIRRAAIALNGSFFNTERMLREYSSVVYKGGAVK